jgi:pimeloyl-ACP methyl ester carboxylesterase
MIGRRSILAGLGIFGGLAALPGCASSATGGAGAGAQPAGSRAATTASDPPAASAQPACPPGTRFSVTVQGQGPDVVLIPGLASSSAVFDATAARLAASHTVHQVQVAGFAGAPVGGNAGPGDRLPGLVGELGAYLDCLGRPASVIGHSMGGVAGMLLARDHAASVARLMVVDALPFFSLLIRPDATPAMIAPFAAATAAMIRAQTPEQFRAVQERTMVTLVKDPVWRTRALEASLASDRDLVAAITAEVMQLDLRPHLARITAPTTVLYAYDPAMPAPPDRVEALYASSYAGLAGVSLVRIDGSLHFIMQDQPAAFDAAVDRFLVPR